MSRHRLPRRSGHVDAQRAATGVYSRRRAPAPAVYRQALAYAAPVATFDSLGGFEEGISIYRCLPVARGPCDRSALRLPDKPGSQQHSWP